MPRKTLEMDETPEEFPPTEEPPTGDDIPDVYQDTTEDAEARRTELERLRAEIARRDQADAQREREEIDRMRAEIAQRDSTRASEDPELYAHLSNGEVVRVRESELPGAAGSNALHGYWKQDGKVHHIIGVYPVETDDPNAQVKE
jgi:hypothetical protein